MKRFLTIIILLFIFLLTGCGETTDSKKTEKDMFVIIQQYDAGSHPYDVVYQKDTKVMYTISHGPYSRGSFTLLVNSDGTPMLYEEESEGEE